MMQHRILLLETEFSTRLNEIVAATWQGSSLKMSLGAGDAHCPLPGCSRALLGVRLAPGGPS